MQFSDAELDELRAIYSEEFGYDISCDDADEMGARLVEFLQLLHAADNERDHSLPGAGGL